MSARHTQIREERVGLCMRDRPIDMLFGGLKVAYPQEYGNSPHQGDRERDGVVHPCGVLDGLLRACDGLSRVTLQPQRSRQVRTGDVVMIGALKDRAGASRTRT